MSTIAEVAMEQLQCCAAQCGIVFWVPTEWARERRRDHVWFYCPNGHHQHWPQKSETEKLREQLAREKHNAEQTQARMRDDLQRERRARTVAERQLSAARGQVTKIKNRVGKGVCPCCSRTFANLQRHMQGQHPDWSPETVEV